MRLLDQCDDVKEEDFYSLEIATGLFKEINSDLISCFDSLEAILSKGDCNQTDVEKLKLTKPNSIDVQYFTEFHDYHSHLISVYEDKKLTLCLLNATVLEAKNRAAIFYGSSDAEQWPGKHNDYITEFIRRGFESDYFIEYLETLYSNLQMLDLCFSVAKGVIKQFPVWDEEDFGFQLLKAPIHSMTEVERLASEELDLNKKLLIYQNEILRMQIYMTEYSEKYYYESEKEYKLRIDDVEQFISKCENHCRIIRELISGEKTSISLAVPPHKAPKYTIKPAPKKKTDIIKILSAMYDAKMFVGEDGKPVTNKQKMMEAFGEFLGDDFTAYSASLSQAKNRDEKTFLKPFKEIEKEALRYFEEVSE